MELMAFAFPHDAESPTFITEFPCILAEVANTFSVKFYTNDNRRFYSITRWDEHQRNERRASSRFPGPEDPESAPDKGFYGNHGFSDDSSGTSVHGDGNTVPGTGEQGKPPIAPHKGGKPETSTEITLISDDGKTSPRKNSQELTRQFDEWYAEYPKKADKQAAKRAFEKALKLTSFETLMAGARHYRDDPNRDPQYTKNPATWLNKGSWDNEAQAPRGNTPTRNPMADRFAANMAVVQRFAQREQEQEHLQSLTQIGER